MPLRARAVLLTEGHVGKQKLRFGAVREGLAVLRDFLTRRCRIAGAETGTNQACSMQRIAWLQRYRRIELRGTALEVASARSTRSVAASGFWATSSA